MYPVPTQCPICGGEVAVTRLKCHSCEAAIEGSFALGPITRLTPEQWAFLETFIRCEGKITRVEKELNISYPTVRARLDDLILAFGYEPAADEEEPVSDEERRLILDELAQGRITSEEAVARLRAR